MRGQLAWSVHGHREQPTHLKAPHTGQSSVEHGVAEFACGSCRRWRRSRCAPVACRHVQQDLVALRCAPALVDDHHPKGIVGAVPAKRGALGKGGGAANGRQAATRGVGLYLQLFALPAAERPLAAV